MDKTLRYVGRREGGRSATLWLNNLTNFGLEENSSIPQHLVR